MTTQQPSESSAHCTSVSFFDDVFGNGVSESDFSDFVWDNRFDDEESADEDKADETEFVIDFYEEDICDEDECDAEEMPEDILKE